MDPKKSKARFSTRHLTRPLCPEHGVSLLVKRTVGAVQYRYCQVPGCRHSMTTHRSFAPHKRWPRENDSPVEVKPNSENIGLSAAEHCLASRDRVDPVEHDPHAIAPVPVAA